MLPSTRARPLKSSTLAKFRQIRPFHRIWRNFAKFVLFIEFVIFVEFAASALPSSRARSLKSLTLAKFHQIRHFLRNYHRFRQIRCFRATLFSSSFPQIFDFGEISSNPSFSSNSLLSCYPPLQLVPSKLQLWRNFAKFVIFVEFVVFIKFAAFVLPSSRARSLKSSTLAKFRQIRHFRRICHFRRIRRFRATIASSQARSLKSSSFSSNSSNLSLLTATLLSSLFPQIFNFGEISPNSSFLSLRAFLDIFRKK